MRRRFTYALLVAAVSAGLVAGSPVLLAQAHRKTPANAKAAAGKTTPKTNSRTASKTGRRAGSKAGSRTVSGGTAPGTGRSSRLRTATRVAVRRTRYTPERSTAPATLGTGAEEDYRAGSYRAGGYEAGYRNGYDAGLAAARKPLAGESADATMTARDQISAQAGVNSLRTHVPSASGSLTAWDSAERPARTPDRSETTETETQETPPLDQVATLHMSGAGMPAPLRGSLASLERQNARLEADGLERILDEADLSSRVENKLLVPLPASAALLVNPSLEENHRYCRTWTARFLADLARAHAAAFHKPIEVNSAVRTVEYQKRLMNSNGNAAAAEGDIVSPHLTGATIDIAKQGLSGKELAWMRRQLLGLQEAGKIDVEEEFQQACFHITVYKSYTTPLPRHKAGQPATTSQGAGTRRKVGQPTDETPTEMPVEGIPSQGR